MPNRIIRESCTTSPTLDALSDGAERMFWRLTTIADDYGRFDADPRVLLAKCFPLRVGRISIKTIEKYVREMVKSSLISLYEVAGRIYGYFLTWEKHQRLRAKTSKYPEPCQQNVLLSDDGRRQQMSALTESETETETETNICRDAKVLQATAEEPRRLHSNEFKSQAKEILTFLNEKAKRNYQPVEVNIDFIIHRLQEGATLKQCRQIIVRKARDWLSDPKMNQYLRPATLFNKTKFSQYVGELVVSVPEEEPA